MKIGIDDLATSQRCFQRHERIRQSRAACSCKSSSATNSSALMRVAARMTGGAHSASNASCQRVTHKHQRSPATSPGKPNSGTGVLRSFPRAKLNSRDSSVVIAQTMCRPRSRRLCGSNRPDKNRERIAAARFGSAPEDIRRFSRAPISAAKSTSSHQALPGDLRTFPCPDAGSDLADREIGPSS